MPTTLNFSSNFEVLGEIAGTVEGMQNTFDNEQYVDALVEDAHNRASLEFDMAAASAGAAGMIPHVYEFGVGGITRGPVRISDPLSEAARLWTHEIEGSAGQYVIEPKFRPAIVPNPQPTTKYTGVPSKVLKKLSRRRYVFWNKAVVMESGMEVEIHAKSGELLFVPFGRNNVRDDGRTYMMWRYPTLGPIRATPGESTQGTFTALWESWWNLSGDRMMTEDIDAKVSLDVNAALASSAQRAAAVKIKPMGTSKPESKSKTASQKTQAVMIKKSKARRGTKRK